MPFCFMKVRNIVRHLHTVNQHRRLVRHYCFKLGLYGQGLIHDLSKYSPAEFLPGIRYYQGFRSPHEQERRENGYSLAWMHHKGRNKHHFEYWNDVNPDSHKYEPVEMPMKYVKEMFCDRLAATHIYNGDKYTDSDALKYYQLTTAKDLMHPKTAELLESWLVMLSEKGEEETIQYIRENY